MSLNMERPNEHSMYPHIKYRPDKVVLGISLVEEVFFCFWGQTASLALQLQVLTIKCCDMVLISRNFLNIPRNTSRHMEASGCRAECDRMAEVAQEKQRSVRDAEMRLDMKGRQEG